MGETSRVGGGDGRGGLVQNKVEAAYRRTDLFERRHRLMDDWAACLAGESRGWGRRPIR